MNTFEAVTHVLSEHYELFTASELLLSSQTSQADAMRWCSCPEKRSIQFETGSNPNRS